MQSLVGKQIPHLFARNRPFIGMSFWFSYQLYSYFVDSIGYFTGLGGSGGTRDDSNVSVAGGTWCVTNLYCAGGLGGVITVCSCS